MPKMESASARLEDHFRELSDPRRREVTYPLINIVVIAVCAVICSADDFVAIAEQIVAADADYVLAVKGNQPTLFEGIMDFFGDHLEDDFARVDVRRHQTTEKGHGRLEDRWYYLSPVPADLPDRARWKKLKAIGMTVNHTERDGQECLAVCNYSPKQWTCWRSGARQADGRGLFWDWLRRLGREGGEGLVG